MASELNVEVAAIKALVQQESQGHPFLENGLPPILYERRHFFDLSVKKRDKEAEEKEREAEKKAADSKGEKANGAQKKKTHPPKKRVRPKIPIQNFLTFASRTEINAAEATLTNMRSWFAQKL